jgi:hypothetical protein
MVAEELHFFMNPTADGRGPFSSYLPYFFACHAPMRDLAGRAGEDFLHAFKVGVGEAVGGTEARQHAVAVPSGRPDG